MGLRDWITAGLVNFLTAPTGHYQQRGLSDFAQLRRHIHKGDVLLVEGDQRVSAVIKYLTQSSWSHAALYIGDALLARGGLWRERALESFGDDAHHLLVEALFDGVVVTPLSKYLNYNVRLCRPHRLRGEDLELVIEEAIAAVGWRYDLRNILDLAVHLTKASLMPRRSRLEALRLGSGATTEVICTSLLGRLFDKVGFPVLAAVSFPEGVEPRLSAPRRSLRSFMLRERPHYPGVFRRHHPTLLTPRDFDLSPYFEIVKYSVTTDRGFDYQRITWEDEPAA